ncbi:MAG: hypothetical protein WED87_02310, partial [Dehalococcoidia bacterium]
MVYWSLPRAAILAASLQAASAFASSAARAQNYEVWAIDQGTNIIHIFNSMLEEVAKIDMGAHGVRVPHMIDFTS